MECEHKRLMSKHALVDRRAELPRPMTIILEEDVVSGNSHITQSHADHLPSTLPSADWRSITRYNNAPYRSLAAQN